MLLQSADLVVNFQLDKNRRRYLELLKDKIEYHRSPRARCIRITVKSGPRIHVTIPRQGSLRQAQDFVRLKMDWIQQVIQRLAARHPDGAIQPRKQLAVTEQMIAQQGLLFDRLRELAAQHGFSYRNAAIRNQKSRWGSCSSQNNINLNIHLLNLPAHLRDYVILHELAHTEHKNHSKHFWARLDKTIGGRSKDLRKEMHKYSLMM